MKTKNKSCRCPVCGQWYIGEMSVRPVKIWKDLTRDDHITVLQSHCTRCGFEFETGLLVKPKKAVSTEKEQAVIALPRPEAEEPAEEPSKDVLRFRGGPFLLLLAAVALLASIIDGYLSLHLVSMGARELNPLLDSFLRRGPIHFVTIKYLLTSFAVVVFVLFHDHRFLSSRLTGRHALLATQAVFSFLIVYQVSILP